MPEITLKHRTPTGELLQATFWPEKGMNLLSFKKGSLEVIDQSTKTLFDERFAGLGALIGPHFHHRPLAVIPKIQDESLFPHIARVKAKGVQEPFSHGIGRYAPWKAESSDAHIRACLSGKDVWNGVPLSALEGQNFTMELEVHLKENGLYLNLSVVSDTASVVGVHYYYHLPQEKGRVISSIQPSVRINNTLQPLPSEWPISLQHQVTLDLDTPFDTNFRPYPDSLRGNILLDALDYQLRTLFECPCAENSWQLYHPKDASFVCIEPLSAQDPRHPNLTVSSLKIHLEIL